MKDKEKIEILIRDNKTLIEENKRLQKETENEKIKEFCKILEEHRRITDELKNCMKKSEKLRIQNKKMKYKYQKICCSPN